MTIIGRIARTMMKSISTQRTLRQVRTLTLSATHCQNAAADFEKAVARLNTLKNEPSNEVKLQIYALFKQGTEGKCNKPKPGMMDFVGKVKWEAWNSLGDMEKEKAMHAYVSLVNDLAKEDSGTVEAEASPSQEKTYEGMLVTKENGVFKICLNRPDKKNAITWKMYEQWIEALADAAKDDTIGVAVVTGAGDFFCSGNDLSNFTKFGSDMTPQEMAKMGRDVLLRFVGAFVDFPKPLIGLINGPAVGVSVSTLGLYDAVFAADHATFHMPFSNLGQTPEGCSSYIFPRLMGYSRASSLIMFNKKFNAHEAKDMGLITEVYPKDAFLQETEKKVKEYAALPPQTLRHAKELIRGNSRATLHAVNEAECNRLQERWTSDECVNAIMAFFSRKAKM